MEKEKTPKKRGRKPGSKNKVKKDKSVLEKAPEKKKRGRKPKTNITINENPIFTSDENKNKNLIIKINNTSIDSLDNMNKLDCNFHFNNNISNEINNNEKYTNGKLCCSSTANLLVKRKDQLLTPPLESGCLPGIMRQQGLDAGLIKEANISRDPYPEDEWFLINSLSCKSIKQVNDQSLQICSEAKELWLSLLHKKTYN